MLSSFGPATTERLHGRRPEDGDLDAYVRFFTDPRIDEESWPADLRTADDAAHVLRETIEHWDRWGFGAWTVVERSDRRDRRAASAWPTRP